MRRKITLISLDIDDTLTGKDGKIAPAHLAAVARARSAGVDVVLNTGRRWRDSADRYAAELGVTSPVICYAGAMVVDPLTGGLMEHRPLPMHLAMALAEEAARREAALNVYIDDHIYRTGIAPDFALPGTAPGNPPPGSLPPEVPGGSLAAFIRREVAVPTQLLVVGRRAVDAMLPVVAPLAQPGWAWSGGDGGGGTGTGTGELQVYVHDYTTPLCRMTILKGGVSKGYALEIYCRLHGHDLANVLAMGDGEIDASMLAVAGVGVAMAWSPPEVKAVAKEVADPEDPHPVATFIDRYVR